MAVEKEPEHKKTKGNFILIMSRESIQSCEINGHRHEKLCLCHIQKKF